VLGTKTFIAIEEWGADREEERRVENTQRRITIATFQNLQDDGVHGVGGSCLLAALGRHVHHYLAGIEAFSVEELERVVAAVLQSLGVTQLLPQSQRPSVDGVSLAACTS
jgi:hypothetical protein